MESRISRSAPALFLLFWLATPSFAQQPQFACPLPPPPDAPSCGSPEFTSCGIDVDQLERHFCIHVPAQPVENLPVIWGFHGRNNDAGTMVGHLQDQTEQGMVLVTPSAIPSAEACVVQWRFLNEVRLDWSSFDSSEDDQCLILSEPPTRNDADLRFVMVLMAELETQLQDPQGHWALGFSNGATMVYQLMITNPISAQFEGFAPLANAMNKVQIANSQSGNGAVFGAEIEVKHPVIALQGTADRVFVPIQRMAERTVELAAANDGQGGPCDLSQTMSVAQVFRCWSSEPVEEDWPMRSYQDRGLETRLWLMQRNNPQRRPYESLYPDLGHGRDTTYRQEDATVSVRREWPARSAGNSQPVVWINSIDAEHTLPGSRGNFPPCGNNSCDLDMIQEVLQFWRANAGLVTISP